MLRDLFTNSQAIDNFFKSLLPKYRPLFRPRSRQRVKNPLNVGRRRSVSLAHRGGLTSLSAPLPHPCYGYLSWIIVSSATNGYCKAQWISRKGLSLSFSYSFTVVFVHITCPPFPRNFPENVSHDCVAIFLPFGVKV